MDWISVILVIVLSVGIFYIINYKRYRSPIDSMDHQTIRLSKNKQRIIDVYINQSIMIPFDIIEELAYLKTDSDKDIIAFIESQRYNWKQENNKKVYKGDF